MLPVTCRYTTVAAASCAGVGNSSCFLHQSLLTRPGGAQSGLETEEECVGAGTRCVLAPNPPCPPCLFPTPVLSIHLLRPLHLPGVTDALQTVPRHHNNPHDNFSQGAPLGTPWPGKLPEWVLWTLCSAVASTASPEEPKFP